MLSSSTKTSLYTQDGCGKCLNYQPLKNLDMEMWEYIVWVKTWCIRYDKIAKQNVSRVFCGKALPAKYSQKPAVTICHDSSHSSHVLST